MNHNIAPHFSEIFSAEPTSTSFAPGRVSLLGEHIDMHGGHVLPMALPFGISLAAKTIKGDRDHIASAQFDDVAEHPCGAAKTDHWSDYIAGALDAARREGWLESAVNVYCDSAIPVGAGLSSSAATIIAALNAFAPEAISPAELALVAQKVEHAYIGMPCGIMDQMAIAVPAPGEILLLNCRSLGYQRLALPAGWDIAVVHSGQHRQLADGRYRQRVEEAQSARAQLGIDYLTDITPHDGMPEFSDPILTRRVRHIAAEARRVMQAVDALKHDDAKAFGALMQQGHRSMAEDFEASTPEIDALVADAMALGAYGARITGAGFGGCIVALLKSGQKPDWWQGLASKHDMARLLY